MKDDFLKVAYQLLKRQFGDISKSSWIWVDFFNDEESGFTYFKEQIENDEDFACLKDDTYYFYFTRIKRSFIVFYLVDY